MLLNIVGIPLWRRCPTKFKKPILRYDRLVCLSLPSSAHPIDILYSFFSIPLWNPFSLPQDTMIIANFNGVLMDKEFWHDPEVFRPERFLDARGHIQVPDQYLPFGAGEYKKCRNVHVWETSTLLLISQKVTKKKSRFYKIAFWLMFLDWCSLPINR